MVSSAILLHFEDSTHSPEQFTKYLTRKPCKVLGRAASSSIRDEMVYEGYIVTYYTHIILIKNTYIVQHSNTNCKNLAIYSTKAKYI